MKKLLLFIFLSSAFVQAQTCSNVTKDSKTGKAMLIGNGTRESFADSNYSGWFEAGYKNYKPHFTDEKGFSKKLKKYKIKIVMGTWCSDSRREVPAFYKMLDELKYPTDKIDLVFVDRKLHAPNENTKKENITNVPTIIVSEKGKEVGRIIESPINTLESDLYDIVNGKEIKEK